jgi:hypothetical protein
LLATLVIGALGGCGASGSTTASSDRATLQERKQYLHEADKLCQDNTYKTLEEREAWERKSGIPVGRPNRAEMEEEIVRFMAPAVLRRVKEIEGVPMPPADADQLRQFYDAFRAAGERAEKNPKLQVGYPNIYSHVKRLAMAYGFVACGTG